MKEIILLPLLLAFVITSFAQEKVNLFVRVFNPAGKKIHKGHVIKVTDTSLQLKGESTPVDIPVRSIGYIKTKRIYRVYFRSCCGDPDPGFMQFSPGELAAAGALFGLGAGAVIGGLTVLAKNPNSYLINGDISNWKAFQSLITGSNN